jgi:ATP-dependent helicase HepA
MWKVGDSVAHRDNAELGIGRVASVEGRTLVVEFPRTGEALRFGAATDALVAVDESGVHAIDLSPVERLAQGHVDSIEAFALRLDTLHLAASRESDDIASFLGGRIRLFPHQLDVALKATREDPVRWLLADEVGLGKTVEACLIANHLIRARRADRTLVIAPETLTVQWLGELWRKYHQVFVLLDAARLADVEKDFGPGFNPFEAHRRIVIGLRTLVERPRLTEQAIAAGIDLLIVDEAHHLRRPPGHPGDPAYRAVAPIAALGRHALLLTATPLEDDAHGFFRLIQMLRPDAFPDEDFEGRVSRREPLPPCASSTRRADIGGLPPRVHVPIDSGDDPGWEALDALLGALSLRPAEHAVARREKAGLIRAALSSGPSLLSKISRDDRALREAAADWRDADPRLAWLAREGPRFRDQGDKTLVFAAERASIEWLRSELSRRAQLRTGTFHEDLSPGQRDIEVGQFRSPSGPSMLLATECGGEGRNFEFCRRIVLFDLPWSPSTLEQRIGRLDRIGRDRPVEIVTLAPPRGLGASIASLYESVGIFREPLGGLEREMARIEGAIEEAATAPAGTVPPSFFDDAVREARDARDRMREAACHTMFRDPYLPERAEEILARVPEGLEELTEDVVLGACESLAFHVEEHRQGRVHAIEFGRRARVDSLPGVPGGSSFLGTFSREDAVADESIDFYASGHPLVEGLLAEIEDGAIGRSAILHVDRDGETGVGLLALYRRPGGFDAVCVDATGGPRPDWAASLTVRPLRTRRVNAEGLVAAATWADGVRSMAAALPTGRRPDAVAMVIVGR